MSAPIDKYNPAANGPDRSKQDRQKLGLQGQGRSYESILQRLPQALPAALSAAVRAGDAAAADRILATATVPQAAFDDMLATASAGGCVALWDVLDRRLLAPLTAADRQPFYLNMLSVAALHGHGHIIPWVEARAALHNDVGLRMAATGGHLALAQEFYARGAGDPQMMTTALVAAVRQNHMKVIEWMTAQGLGDQKRALREAASNGNIALAAWFYERCEPHQYTLDGALTLASRHQHIAMMDWLYERGARIETGRFNNAALQAAILGHVPVLQWLHNRGVDLRQQNNLAFHTAVLNGRIATAQWLHTVCACDNDAEDKALYEAAINKHWAIAAWLHTERGRPLPDKTTADALARWQEWQKRHGQCPEGLEDLSPYLFRPQVFNDIAAMLAKEKHSPHVINRRAYHAAGLFRSTDRVLAYLEKWGAGGPAPLGTLLENLVLSQKGRFNIAAWGDAVLRQGPKMASLVRFAGVLPEPERDATGRYSYTLTRARVAENAYERGAENPALAALSYRYNWESEVFEDALALMGAYRHAYGDAGKDPTRIPAITIDGAQFGKPDHVFYRLPDGDARSLLLGNLSGCCQHLLGYGADCAKHGLLSPHGGFYVIAARKDDEIIGQSWAWRGSKGELVLDSLESRAGTMDTAQWRSLTQSFARAAQADPAAGVTAVLVGTKGNTPEDIGYPVVRAKNLAEPVDYQGYRDSRKQYRVTRAAARKPS